MSQVRKFKDGGGTAAQSEQQSSTEAKQKYRLIINGKEMLLDDDSLAAFRKAGSGQGGMMGNVYADIADALQAGKTVRYNSDSNTISGVDFKRVDPTAIAKANENQVWDKKAQRRANRYARRNNLTHQFNSALASIGNINFEKRKDEEASSSDSSKLSLFGSYNPFQYNVDDEGNTTFANSPWNATAKKYIDAYANLATLTREQAKEKYNFDDEKYDQFMNWYNTYGQNYNWIGEGDSLWNRIQDKNYNENDDELLALLGWNIDNSSDNSSGSTNTPRSYEGSGLNNDWLTKNNYYVRKGSDGNTYLYRLGTDENGKPKYLIDTSAKIYLPNMGILGENSQWNGGAIINGRFYTENEIWDPNSTAGQSFAELTRAWNSGSGETSWQNAKNTEWQFAGSNADNYMFSTYDRNTGTNPLWDQYFNQYKDDDNIWYVRNLANNFSGTPKGMEIISYIDQNNRSRAGYENPYFAVYNPTDKKFRRFENEEALSSYLQGLNIQKQSSLYSGDANFDIHDFLFDKNKNRYSYVSPINTFTGTGSSQQSTELYRGPDENYYYLLDNSNPEDLQFVRIDDQNVVNQILNGQTISNENLPSWAKRRLLEREKRRYMKQGGKINFDKINYLQKYQYGGIFSNPYIGSTNKVERNKDAKITIGDSHQAFGGGKHGVRTKADKLANWATGFDTAAVGTSFIPVYGNIVGAVSGLTGSALRFASDIKKDGFQGKDLWKFLGNVGLDALTLIPGLGSAAAGVKAAKGASKVAKVASTIAKGAGKVSKWGDTTKVGKAVTYGLPAIGVLQGTSAAIQAATDRQPLTTDQLQTIAGGLIGGVMLGNKAGKVFNNKALKSVQRELGISKPKEFSYKGVKLTDSDISGLQGKKVKEVNEFLYNKLKDSKVDLKDISTDFKKSTLYNDFGLNLNGKIFKKINIPKNRENIELTNPKLYNRLRNANSFWDKRAAAAYREELLANPNALKSLGLTNKLSIDPAWRFGGINASWGTAPKNIYLNKANITRTGRQILSKMYHSGVSNIQSAKDYVTKNMTPDKQEYWLDLLTKRNKDFNKLFKNLNKVKNNAAQRVKLFDSFKFQQGGKIVKAQPGTKMPFGTFVTDSSSVDPNLFNYQKSGIQFNDSNVDWTKTYGDGTFMNYRQQYLNNWDNTAFKPVIDAYLAQLSKGNNNVDLSNFSKEDFARLTQDQKLGYAHNLYTDAFANYLKSNTPATVLSRGPLTGNTPILNIPTPELGTPAPIMSREELDSKRDENIKTDGSQAVGGQGDGSPIGETKSGKGFNWDPDTFIGLANLGYSVHKNNQMYGVLDDAIRKSGRALQKEMPTEIYDRYQDHITPIYQEVANNKRQFFVPTSTDALTNYAIRQTNEDTAQQLLTEGKLKASEAYSQYLDKDLAARRAYADARREIANQNRAIMASTIMQLGQNDAARRLANNQSVQNFVMEFRNKLAQDKTKRDNLIQSYYTTKAQNDYNTAFRNYLSNADGKNYYQLFKEATDKAPNETFDDWLYRTDMNAYNKANEAGIAAAGETRWNGAASALNWFGLPEYPGLVSNMPTSQTSVPLGSFKSGGKTPKYMQRHTGQKPDEAIWIQRNKDTAKALEKLHDAVIKLFMKTLS